MNRKNSRAFSDKIKALFVDDDVDMLKQAKSVIESQDEHLSVDTTISVEEALDLFEENEYDAIVSDYMMPNMNGLDFLRVLREEKDSEVPFIMFTGRGEEEVALQALNLGATNYFTKSEDLKSQYASLAQKIVDSVENWRTRKALKKERKMKEKYMEVADCIVLHVNVEGEVVQINETGSEMIGEDKDEIIGKNWFTNYVPEEFRDEARKTFNDLLKEEVEDCNSLEIPILNADGEEQHLIWRNTPLRDEQENIIGIICSGIDITEKKEMEEKLRQYKRAVEFSEDLIAGIDQNYSYLFVNQTFLEYFDVDEEDIVGKKAGDIIDEEVFRKIKPYMDRCLKGESVQYEMTYEISDEDELYLDTYYYPLRDNDGEIYGIVASIRDITEKRKSELEERKRHLVFAASEAIVENIAPRYGVRISAAELGLKKELSYLADLATQPTTPEAVFDFLIKGIRRTLEDKGAEVERGEVRGAVIPVFRDFLKNILKLAERYGLDIPEEYRNFEKHFVHSS